MASMSIFRYSFLNFSKTSPKCPSITTLRPTKVSRVCFTSASRKPEGRNADDRTKDYNPYDADESISEPRDDVKVTMDKAKEKTREMKEKTKGHAESMKEKTNDAAGFAKARTDEMNKKTQENVSSMADKAHEMKDKAMDSAGKMADKTKKQTKDAADTAAGKTTEYAHGAKESTKGMAEKMADTAQSLGEQAKQKVQGAAQMIKETVIGKSNDDDVGDLKDYMEDYEKKLEREGKGEKAMDEDVVDLRRRAAEGHDQK